MRLNLTRSNAVPYLEMLLGFAIGFTAWLSLPKIPIPLPMYLMLGWLFLVSTALAIPRLGVKQREVTLPFFTFTLVALFVDWLVALLGLYALVIAGYLVIRGSQPPTVTKVQIDANGNKFMTGKTDASGRVVFHIPEDFFQ